MRTRKKCRKLFKKPSQTTKSTWLSPKKRVVETTSTTRKPKRCLRSLSPRTHRSKRKSHWNNLWSWVGFILQCSSLGCLKTGSSMRSTASASLVSTLVSSSTSETGTSNGVLISWTIWESILVSKMNLLWRMRCLVHSWEPREAIQMRAESIQVMPS